MPAGRCPSRWEWPATRRRRPSRRRWRSSRAAPAAEPAPAAALEAANIVLDCRTNAAYAAVFALLKEKAEVRRSKDMIRGEGFEAAAGSFIVKNSPGVRKALPDILKKWPVKPAALADASAVPSTAIRAPRIGLYQSWRGNMDEGWTRYVFDDLGVPYTTLHNDAFQAGQRQEGREGRPQGRTMTLSSSPTRAPTSSRRENADPESGTAPFVHAGLPPEYEGGIEKEGVDALKAFVEAGGIVVTLNGACELASRTSSAPARNVLEKVERTRFFCPTSILRIEVDNATPIGYGMPEKAAAVFADSPALNTRIPPADWDRRVVAAYPEADVLLSGWLLGEDVIARKAAVVDTRYKEGRIILIGIPCQNRAQSHGTYKFLLNALLYPRP